MFDFDTCDDYIAEKCGKGSRFMVIWEFMIDDLGLSGTELSVYAVIFGMHKSYCDGFLGSREFLQKWSCAGKTSVHNALASLERKKLIRKEMRHYGRVQKAVYYINTEALPTLDMFALENRNRDNNRRIRQAEAKRSISAS